MLSRAYLREIIFGLEDSFVSTLGAVTGIAAGSHDRSIVILSGFVIVAVEALSMAAGSYLSSKAVSDAEPEARKDEGDLLHPALGGAVMGISYAIAGLVPLAPYVFAPLGVATGVSVGLTLLMLFASGVWQTRYTKRHWGKSGLEMLLVGGAAIGLGYLVGRLTTSML